MDGNAYALDIGAGDDGAMYRHRNAERCACKGHFMDSQHERHLIWLGFVVDDAQATTPLTLLNWLMIKLTSLLSGSDITHAQIVFYDHDAQRFYTYSANMQNGVACSFTKEFSNSGWRFLQIDVSERQEMAVRRALIEQLDKPFDFWGALRAFFWPRQTTGRAWFCSELALTALKAAGLATTAAEPYRMLPHMLYAYMTRYYNDTLCTELTYTDKTGVVRPINPVMISKRQATGRMNYVY